MRGHYNFWFCFGGVLLILSAPCGALALAQLFAYIFLGVELIGGPRVGAAAVTGALALVLGLGCWFMSDHGTSGHLERHMRAREGLREKRESLRLEGLREQERLLTEALTPHRPERHQPLDPPAAGQRTRTGEDSERI